jgi:flagellar basal-body rod protein FlgF
MRQGFIEASNVNPVLEIARLIEVQRSFEIGQQVLSDENDRARRAIESLGGQR